MSIKYTVAENPLQPGQFYPRPVAQGNRNLEVLLRNIAERTTISPADTEAVVKAFIQEVINGLADGDRVSIDRLCDFRTRLSQNMTSAADSMNLAQGGAIFVSATIKPAVTKEIRNRSRLEKVVRATKIPVILSFFDETTQQLKQYTPGSMATIAGQGLKISDREAGSDEGLYFVSQLDGAESKVVTLGNNGDRKLIFIVPPGLNGAQDLQVRTRYTPGGELRVGVFKNIDQAPGF